MAALNGMIIICQSLPLAADKIVGPATSLVFQSIEIDSVCMEAQPPDSTLTRLRQKLWQWAALKHCRCRKLEPFCWVYLILPAQCSLLAGASCVK